MVAVGFSIHTGWAAVVVVGGPSPKIVARREIQLADDNHDARFVYHTGADHPDQAERIIRKAEQTARERCAVSLRNLCGELGEERRIAAVPKPKRALPDLATILKSHALIHAAEGDLYRQAIADGAADAGYRVEAVVPAALPDFGKLGPPWGKDQKQAAALAWAVISK